MTRAILLLSLCVSYFFCLCLCLSVSIVGMSDFSHLAASLDTMGTGAEGGAYDPTVIKYLADHYVYSQSPPSLISFSSADGGGIKDALCSQVDRAVQQAISACQNNGKVAAAIGLAGHAATWSAMESLLPSLVNIATSQLKTQQKAQVSAIGASPPHMETSDATASPPAPTTQQNDLSPSLIMPVSTSSSSYSWELMFTIETTGDLLFDMLGMRVVQLKMHIVHMNEAASVYCSIKLTTLMS